VTIRSQSLRKPVAIFGNAAKSPVATFQRGQHSIEQLKIGVAIAVGWRRSQCSALPLAFGRSKKNQDQPQAKQLQPVTAHITVGSS